MAEKTTADPSGPISAEQLRMRMLEAQMKEMELQEKARAAEQKKLAAFTEDFFKHHMRGRADA